METITILIIVAVIWALLKAKGTLAPAATYKVTPQEVAMFRKRIEPFEKYIEEYGDAEWNKGVGPDLLRAIIWTESSGDKNAIRTEWNGEVSRGLMQITAPAASDVGFRDQAIRLLDPETNIKYGSKYIWKLFQDFGGAGVTDAILDAISAYNAGATTVKERKALGKGYSNPQYVARVMSCYWALQGVFDDG